ncbi:MAG: apolipoprotein N-acyltransferase, partial [Lentisphaeria bacterium]
MISLKQLFNKYPLGLFGYRLLKPRFIISLLWMLWGAFIGLSFPPFEFAFLIFLLPLPLAFCSPAKNSLRAMRYGWCFGFGYFFISLFWLYTIHIGAVFFLAGVCALFYGLWFVAINLVEKFSKFPIFIKVISYATLWVSQDFLRGHLFTGFPWNFPGNALWQNPAVAIIRFAGVYGQTFVIILFGLILTTLLKKWQSLSNKVRITGIFLPSFFTILVFNIPVQYDNFEQHFKVMPIQGNIPLMRVYTNEQLNFARDTYINLTKEGLLKSSPQLIIWPETAVPAPLFWDRSYYFPFKELINLHKLPMLVGTIDYRESKVMPTEKLLYNSAMLLNGGGNEVKITELYD